MQREQCSGMCNSYQTNLLQINGIQISNKVCKCCAPDKTRIEKIEMICEKQITIVDYMRIDTCKCESCGIIENSFENFF